MPKLADWQYELIAMKAAHGHDATYIAREVQCDPTTVRDLMSGDNESFKRMKEGYQKNVVHVHEYSKLRFANMNPEAHDKIHEGLTQTTDIRLSMDMAKYVIDRNVPTVQKHQVDHHMSGSVRAIVDKTILSVGATLEDLKTYLAEKGAGGLSRHIKLGVDALPQASVVAPASQPSGANGDGKGAQLLEPESEEVDG